MIFDGCLTNQIFAAKLSNASICSNTHQHGRIEFWRSNGFKCLFSSQMEYICDVIKHMCFPSYVFSHNTLRRE